jgi:transcriptional regulator with XRE-family HTH domain
MSIGKTIKIIRTRAGFKQNEFCELVKCSQNYLSLIENEKRAPSIALIKRISKVLNIPFEFFLLLEYSPPIDAEFEEKQLINKIKELVQELQLLNVEAHQRLDEEKKEIKD